MTFPVQPKVTEITYRSEFGAPLRARVYSAIRPEPLHRDGVDYSTSRRFSPRKPSPASGAENLQGSGSSTGAGYRRADMAGAVIYATAQLMKRDVKVEYFGWNNINLVEGHQLTLVNSDKSKPRLRSTARKRLYILEGTVPPGIRFRISFHSREWLDEKGDFHSL